MSSRRANLFSRLNGLLEKSGRTFPQGLKPVDVGRLMSELKLRPQKAKMARELGRDSLLDRAEGRHRATFAISTTKTVMLTWRVMPHRLPSSAMARGSLGGSMSRQVMASS